ncbi:MAG: DUF2335 domain-containing protein [Treponema sp.]|nr:DUF2335 domain-containing protein [Treponema sp.]
MRNPPSQKENKAVAIQHHEQTQFIGPIPPPEMLKGYYSLKEEYADKIIKMAEENNSANIELEKKALEGNIRINSRAQVFAFIIVLLGYGMASLFGFVLKNTPATVVSIITGTAPLAIAAISGLLKSKPD